SEAEPRTPTSAPPSSTSTRTRVGTAAGTSSNPTSSPPPAESSAPPPSCYPDAPQTLIDTSRAAAPQFLRGDDAGSQFNTLVFFAVAHVVAVDSGHSELLKSIEVKRLQEQTKRTDKQVGTAASAAGSTSLIEKPSFAEVLGFAIEHGAIQ